MEMGVVLRGMRGFCGEKGVDTLFKII